MQKRLKDYTGTINYILLILLINIGYSVLPVFRFLGGELSPLDPIAGVVYLCRDFAQRELGHYVFIAMAIGTGLSYFLADPHIAIASISAFIAGEIIDYAIFTFTQKPLSQRLIWSASLSAPIDSIVFLHFIQRLNWVSFIVMTLGKVAGVLIIWLTWRLRKKHALTA